ncbi:OsmC family protein [Xanthovirga aplysinae]|uniref:OsmC family protein n=1 Tax=Xanthovirga aplysinae TaxID=2529853 RepID=UPI0012BB947B|nr:OsmC family protein [Xanthovirga aplysinae]MTI30520.1 OsmC family peroxiredoxin [Xanthovirga aplysinae]
MIVTTRFVDDYEFEAENESGNKVKIDMYPKEKKQAQSPMELLLSALGACSAVDLVQMLKKRKKTVTDLNITTEGVRRDEIPRSFTDISLTFTLTSPDATLEEFEKLTKLALEKYCSVEASLGGVNINFKCEIK